MTAVEKIKAKILDLAIRGKLVPQEPNDEPASVLLERIKAEKAKLVKAKKIKKDKNPSEIVVGADGATYEKFADGTTKDISDELPFDLPQGWAWARIGDFSFITKLAGFEYSKNIAKVLVNSGIPLVKGKNIQGSSLIEVFEDYIPNEISVALPRSRITRRCLLLPYVGTIGNVAVFDKDYVAHLGSNVAKIEFDIDCGIEEEYVALILRSQTGYRLLTRDKKATAQDSLSMAALRNVIIPVPSSDEQKRIVAKVKELFAYSNTIGEAADDIGMTAERIEKKILDLAIRGQLVPQDQNDEPASELVKRIEAVKRVKAGGHASACAASDRPAYEIDPPFDIPDSWEWVKLKDLGVFVGGHTPSLADPSNWENGTVLWVTSKDMKQKYIEDTGCKLSAKGASELHLLPPGSLIMVTRSGILRRAFPVALAAKPLTINQDQRALQFYDNAIGEYVYCCIKSFESMILRDYRKTGTTVESIIWEKFIGLSIPLPPLAEQKRIVAKVDELKRKTRTLVAS